jgi:hypothetical protein
VVFRYGLTEHLAVAVGSFGPAVMDGWVAWGIYVAAMMP